MTKQTKHIKWTRLYSINMYENVWKCINVLDFSHVSHHATEFCQDTDTSGLGIGSGSVTGTGSGAAPRKLKNQYPNNQIITNYNLMHMC